MRPMSPATRAQIIARLWDRFERAPREEAARDRLTAIEFQAPAQAA